MASKYFRVTWIHDLADEPVVLTFEIDENRREVRKIETYRSGQMDLAGPTTQSGSTRLSSEPVPPPGEIASQDEFEIEEIDRDAFEAVWADALAQLGRSPVVVAEGKRKKDDEPFWVTVITAVFYFVLFWFGFGGLLFVVGVLLYGVLESG